MQNEVSGGVSSEWTVYVGGIYEKNTTTGQVTKYYYAGGKRVAMAKVNVPSIVSLYFFANDHLGGTALVSTETGALCSRVRYYPYGSIRGEEYGAACTSLPTDRLYTGQRRDVGPEVADTFHVGELYHYNSRFYDPQMGRFLQPDTIVPGAGNPQNLNRYAYVNGNPMRYSDPTGHMLREGGGGRRSLFRMRWPRDERWQGLGYGVGCRAAAFCMFPQIKGGGGIFGRGVAAAAAAGVATRIGIETGFEGFTIIGMRPNNSAVPLVPSRLLSTARNILAEMLAEQASTVDAPATTRLEQTMIETPAATSAGIADQMGKKPVERDRDRHIPRPDPSYRPPDLSIPRPTFSDPTSLPPIGPCWQYKGWDQATCWAIIGSGISGGAIYLDSILSDDQPPGPRPYTSP